MTYILDSSFIGTLIIPDEKNQLADNLYRQIKNTDEKYVPFLFWHEITNIFMNLIRRKRNKHDQVLQLFQVLTTIKILIDHESGAEYSKKLLRLSNDYNLSSYDASYLELAERKKAVLCTLDEKLRLAAKKHGVSVIK